MRKLCSFCGGSNSHLSPVGVSPENGTCSHLYQVVCSDCGARAAVKKTEREAWASWDFVDQNETSTLIELLENPPQIRGPSGAEYLNAQHARDLMKRAAGKLRVILFALDRY